VAGNGPLQGGIQSSAAASCAGAAELLVGEGPFSSRYFGFQLQITDIANIA